MRSASGRYILNAHTTCSGLIRENLLILPLPCSLTGISGFFKHSVQSWIKKEMCLTKDTIGLVPFEALFGSLKSQLRKMSAFPEPPIMYSVLAEYVPIASKSLGTLLHVTIRICETQKRISRIIYLIQLPQDISTRNKHFWCVDWYSKDYIQTRRGITYCLTKNLASGFEKRCRSFCRTLEAHYLVCRRI